MGLPDLSVPYSDFKIQEIIDPEQFDANNKNIVENVNAIIDVINQITDSIANGGSGADIISLTAIAPFTSTKLQTFLSDVVGRLKSTQGGASGSELIGSPSISGLVGGTIYSQLVSIKNLLNNTYTRAEVHDQIAIRTGKNGFIDGGNFTDVYTIGHTQIDGGEW